MDRPLVRLSALDRIAILSLDHAERRNALSLAMLEALAGKLDQASRIPDARVLILAAEGPVFSSGHDLRELVDAPGDACQAVFSQCTALMEQIRLLPQPVIAEVAGLATAAGCQLAASCDLVVAAEDAAFATPGVRIGLFCTTPAVALARAVAPKHALEMLFTGEPIAAAEAWRMGLVNRVVPRDRLREETLRLARQIAQAAPEVLALGKRAFYEQLGLDRPAAYAQAQPVMVENALAPAAQEGMRAFLEKRPPRWSE